MSAIRIANPVYDVVFKYLLEDSKIAKLLLSAIIGEEIVELRFRPQERIAESDRRPLTVYRIDFSATIRTSDGLHKVVIIEIQKAKFAADLMRFRRYLGEHYRDRENSYRREMDGHEYGTPIVSIYFLGYPLDSIPEAIPVLRIQREYRDAATGAIIAARDPFIEGLTHDSVVIQIPHITGKRRSELEQLLLIFDQSSTEDNSHLLRIHENDVPAKYHPIIRRLQRAMEEPSVRDTMDVEDDYFDELDTIERRAQEAEERAVAADARAAEAEARAEAERKHSQSLLQELEALKKKV